MRYLDGIEEKVAQEHLQKAAKIAGKSSCQRSRCGSIIVSGDEIIGEGYNSPPANDESQRRCSYPKTSYDPKVTDKTCCVHAEQRAIMDALMRKPHEIVGSRLYFVRVDDDGEPKRSGEPYCTLCSKLALDTGIAEFVLWREQGVCVYNTSEYNTISYQYHG